jgi:rod shape-determining protein MreC
MPSRRPYVAGLLIGTVAHVDDSAGRLTPTAALTPAVDVGRLDLVGVLRTAPRDTPRPTVTGAAP